MVHSCILKLFINFHIPYLDKSINPSLHLLKRKSLKITNSHRHITKSKHQPCIPMQTHDTPLLPLKNTTRNTYLLLFLNILLKRLIHQFNVIRHGFIQINKFSGEKHWVRTDNCQVCLYSCTRCAVPVRG